jgi:hypothetical protein
MPIRWTISHEKRLVVSIADGVVCLKDVEAYFDAIAVADALPYAKLFDATTMDPRLTNEDVMALGARMSAYVAVWPGGPAAYVATSPVAREFIGRFLNLTRAERAVKIFQTLDEARQWLDTRPS